MKIIIRPKDGFNVDNNFIKYLIKVMKVKGLGELDTRRLPLWDAYLNSGALKIQGKRQFSSKEILVAAFNNLVYSKHDAYYSIELDTNEIWPYTNYKLVDLVGLINEGNLELRGYPIIEQTFEDISQNVYRYYKLFKGVI